MADVDYAALAKQYGGTTSTTQAATHDYAALAAQFGGKSAPSQTAETAKPRAWSDVPLDAVKNLPSSAGNFASGIYQAVRHPIDTGMNVLDVLAGGLHNLVPESVSSAIDRAAPSPDTARAVKTADAVGGFYKNRYGSEEGIKNALATDPVGVASDLSTLLTGGAALTAKLPAVSGALRTAANVTNPLNAVGAVASKATDVAGQGAANLIGGLGTHTGAESIKQAYRAGAEGGKVGESFTENMRGNVPATDVLDAAKANVAQMGRDKSAAYRSGMADVSKDQTVLNFQGVDKALQDAAGAVSFKGQVKNQKGAQVVQQIADEVDKWKQLPPDQFHTPEGLDALKQKIGGIVESIPFEEKTAGMVGRNIYNAVKSEITKQAPAYADTMKAYSEASDQIQEIERALSLGKKASADTAMRKLQSLLRNNVNTNYGNRLDLARDLEQQGGRELLPAIAGQALNTWTPRGLGGAVAGGLGLGGYALGGLPTALATMAVQSPRLMGEAALKAGQAARGVNAVAGPSGDLIRQTGMTPAQLGNALYQLGRLPNE